MVIAKSKNNVPVRLTLERWTHIIARHPEMDSQKERVIETLTEPEIIQQGDWKEKGHHPLPLPYCLFPAA